MKIFAYIIRDLKKGENLEIYVSIIASIVLALIGLMGFNNSVVVTSVILAVLGILNISNLKNRNNFENLTKDIEKAKEFSKQTSNELSTAIDTILGKQKEEARIVEDIRELSQEVSSKVIISKSILDTKLDNITMQTIDIDWTDLFANSTQIDLFFTYARTWRHNNSGNLEQFVCKKGNHLRVVLPNPEEEIILKELSNRFSKSTDEFKNLIEEATREYGKLYGIAQKNGAKVEIWHTVVTPMYSMYRFNKVAILALGSYKQTKGFVPHFIANEGGTIYKFVEDEFMTLLGNDGRLISKQIV